MCACVCGPLCLQGSLECPDLWVEAALLGKLIYKNNSQHRGTSYLRRLRHVLRELRLLSAMQLPGCMSDLLSLTQLATSTSTAAAGAGTKGQGTGAAKGSRATSVSSSTRKTHRVPAQEAVAAVLMRLHAATRLLQSLVHAALDAAAQTGAQVARSYFMPLCLTATAMMARLHVLCTQQLLACVSTYNALSSLLPLLPLASEPSTQAAADHAARLAALPRMLHCSLTRPVSLVSSSLDMSPHPSVAAGGQTTATSVAGEKEPQRLGEWVSGQAAALWADLGLMQGMQVESLAAAAPTSTHQTSGATAGPQAEAAAPAGTGAHRPGAGMAGVAVRTGANARSSKLAPADMGVTVSRASFFDMMASRQQQGPGRGSSAQTLPLGGLSVLDDRTKRAAARTAQPQAPAAGMADAQLAGSGVVGAHKDAAVLGAVTGRGQQQAGAAAAVAPVANDAGVVPVYTTAVAGFALGLGARRQVAAGQAQAAVPNPEPAEETATTAATATAVVATAEAADMAPGLQDLVSADNGMKADGQEEWQRGGEGEGGEDEEGGRMMLAANSTSEDEDDMLAEEGYGRRTANVLAAATAAAAAPAAVAAVISAQAAVISAQAAASSAQAAAARIAAAPAAAPAAAARAKPAPAQTAFVRVGSSAPAPVSTAAATSHQQATTKPGTGTAAAAAGAGAKTGTVAATTDTASSGNRMLDIIMGGVPVAAGSSPSATAAGRGPGAPAKGLATTKGASALSSRKQGKGAPAARGGVAHATVTSGGGAGGAGSSWEDILLMGTQPAAEPAAGAHVGSKRKGQGVGKGGPAAKRR